MGRYLDLYEFEGAATEFNIDRVSDEGPRLYCGQKQLLASYSLLPPFLLFELRQAPAVRDWSPLRRNSRRTRAPHDPSKLHPVDRPFGVQIPTGLINKKNRLHLEKVLSLNWRPVGDSNPCCRDENPVS